MTTFQDSLDKFKQYCNFPAKYNTPQGLKEQEAVFEECYKALGPHKFRGVFDKFIDKNRGYEASFLDFRSEAEVKNSIVNEKHYKETMSLMKVNPPVAIPKHLQPREVAGKDTLWNFIHEYEDYNPDTQQMVKINQIQNSSNDNVKLYPKLLEVLKEQVPEFMGVGEPTDYMIKYISSGHTRPFLVGSNHVFKGYRLLKYLQNKIANTTQYCYVSPSKYNSNICVNSVWEDFVKDTKWDESTEAFLTAEKSAASFGNCVGLFNISLIDDPNTFHEKYKKLLQYFVGNGRKAIIAIPKQLQVDNSSWLRYLLQEAITVDLDRRYV